MREGRGQRSEEEGPWSGDGDRERPSSSRDSWSSSRTDQPTSEDESLYGWQGRAVGQSNINHDKKQQALIACADLHAALVDCLKQGFFADCSEPQKAFWECYAKHRGVRGNKIASWFAPPSFSGTRTSA